MSVRARRRGLASEAVVEGILAGALVGLFEGTRATLASGRGTLAAWFVTAGFAIVGASLAAVAIRALLAGALRLRPLAAWRASLAAEDGRTVAVARAGLGAGAVLAFGVVVFRLAAWVHERFRYNDAGAVALLQAVAAIVVGLGLIGAVAWIDRSLVVRLSGRRTFAGRRLAIAGALALVGVVLAPVLVVHRAVPALALTGVVTAALLVAAVLAARGLRLGGRRAAAVASIGLVVVALGGIGASRASGRGRGIVVEHGVLGRVVARTLWHLADRDGDGSPGPLVGGADCDDGDPRRSPREVEAVGNGIDDNCNGAELASLGDRAKSRAAAAPVAARNVVLITVDALRADHLGAWGYPRATSPVIDAFAASATRFARTFTSGPATRLALPSLLAGRYASTVRFVDPPTLAQVLGGAGWDTAAILCCDHLVAADELRGFAEIDRSPNGARLGSPGQANAEAVADRAVAYLAARRHASRPFAVWIHFYDPHHPYVTPADVPPFGDAELDHYDAEIVRADRGIGRVLAALDASGLAGSTIVALASDHGDEFGEHGVRFHARSLYNQVVHVPLVIRAPGAAPRVVDTPTSLVDVAPTLYDLVGVETPGNVNGRSLAGAIRGAALPARPVLVELLPDRQIDRDLIGVVAEGHKLIWDREANDWTLYALDDLGDRDERSDEEPALLARLQALLRELVDRELGQP